MPAAVDKTAVSLAGVNSSPPLPSNDDPAVPRRIH
jgi:hypothetical protein